MSSDVGDGDDGCRTEDDAFVSFLPRMPSLADITGGDEIRPFELLTNLALHHDVYVFETHNSGGSRRRRGRMLIHPLRIPRNPALAEVLRLLLMCWQLWKVRRALRTRNVVVHLMQQTPGPIAFKGLLPVHAKPGFLLLPIARCLGFRTHAVVHDLVPDHEFAMANRIRDGRSRTGRSRRHSSGRWTRASGKLGAVEQAVPLRAAHHVAAASRGIRDRLIERYGLPHEVTTCFRAGVNPSLVSDIPKWMSPSQDATWTAGYLGGPDDTSLWPMMAAAERLGIRVLLAGRGFREAFDATTHHNGCVTVRDPTVYADFPEVARAVDMWVISYDRDPYWQLPWELKLPLYLASGRPVIRTRTAEIEDNQVAQYLYLAEPSTTSLVAAMRRVISEPDQARRKADGARKFVLTHLTWERIVRDVFDPHCTQHSGHREEHAC